MKRLIRTAAARLTRRNALWFLRVNVQAWVIQGALVGLLTVCGLGTLHAMISAKVAAYVVFVGQCLQAARAK